MNRRIAREIARDLVWKWASRVSRPPSDQDLGSLVGGITVLLVGNCGDPPSRPADSARPREEDGNEDRAPALGLRCPRKG